MGTAFHHLTPTLYCSLPESQDAFVRYKTDSLEPRVAEFLWRQGVAKAVVSIPKMGKRPEWEADVK